MRIGSHWGLGALLDGDEVDDLSSGADRAQNVNETELGLRESLTSLGGVPYAYGAEGVHSASAPLRCCLGLGRTTLLRVSTEQ